MDPLDALAAAQAEFDRRLHAVADGDWATPTPCEGWTVRDLVIHVVGGCTMSTRLLHGASVEEALDGVRADPGGDLRDDFAQRAEEQAAAFREPGALERVVHHPAMDMPGAQLLGFRIGDMALHAWDLARAIGADEALGDELAAHVWETLEPMAPFIGQVGVFGSGPSGSVGEDAPLQVRLLDLSGRRP